jgi:diaminopimelate dehydrogenase
MAECIRAAIAGYGNLGRGVESALLQNPDFSLAAIVTRRDPASLSPASGVKVVREADIASLKGQIDVLFVCGGSATDLPEQTPRLAEDFCVVDSFDTHARIPEHFAAVDAAAKKGGNLALISVGWDPGLFSLARLYETAVLPQGKDYTFWGRGISQGHSDAIRRLPGVLDARQYTVPVPEAVEAVRSGECPELTTRQKHRRECYVAAAPGTDLEELTRQICSMPNYFADYDTTVTYVTLEELRTQHKELPHGGFVIRNGRSGPDGRYRQTMELRLDLDSNPFFTGSVLAACGRAVVRLHRKGETGCRTILDIPPALLSPLSGEELRREFV